MPRILLTFALVLALPPQCQAPQVQVPGDAAFVGSAQGEVYYPVACEAWRSLSQRNLRYFRSAEEAAAAGLRPTTHPDCFPPPFADQTARGDVDRADVCTIVRIIDGDTVDCAESSRNARLLLIDAPEVDQGSHGRAAGQALSKLLPIGTRTRIEYDVARQDRYQRHLVYLYLPDGRMVNEEIVRLGFAVLAIYPPNVRHVERIRAAADEARQAERGLWKERGFECLPADFRADRCD